MYKIEGTKVLELVTSVHLDNKTKFQKWVLVGSFSSVDEAQKMKTMFEAMGA
jgi:hypothetical protein